MKPFSQACVENATPILEQLTVLFAECRTVLEIASGTGQHAVHFAPHLSQLVWQTSDVESNLAGIRLWLEEAQCANTPAPISLDVTQSAWPAMQPDAIFCANAVHIMPWSSVCALYRGVGQMLKPGGLLVLYGPFNYGNQYTSESNYQFDYWLKRQNVESGIRNFEDLDRLASDAGLTFMKDIPMPSYNHMLCWVRA